MQISHKNMVNQDENARSIPESSSTATPTPTTLERNLWAMERASIYLIVAGAALSVPSIPSMDIFLHQTPDYSPTQVKEKHLSTMNSTNVRCPRCNMVHRQSEFIDRPCTTQRHHAIHENQVTDTTNDKCSMLEAYLAYFKTPQLIEFDIHCEPSQDNHNCSPQLSIDPSINLKTKGKPMTRAKVNALFDHLTSKVRMMLDTGKASSPEIPDHDLDPNTPIHAGQERNTKSKKSNYIHRNALDGRSRRRIPGDC